MAFSVLKKRADFLRVGLKARKISTKTIILLAAPNELAAIRVGYTISKKTSKLAVERNKIKRRLKSIMAEVLESLGEKGCDYVVIGKREALTRNFTDLKNDVKYALKKISTVKS